MKNLDYLRILWIMALAVVLSGAACSQVNPVAQAETAEQKAYAAYGTYVIFAEKAADLAERPDISNSVKLALINAEERAGDVADDVLDTVLEVDQIRGEVVAGTTGEERLLIVLTNLNDYVNRLVPLADELVRQVKGADR